MSHFSETLRALLAKHAKTAVELEAASGVDRTTISRLLRGVHAPSRPKLASLCVAISPEAKERAALLLAHLRDEAADTFRRAGLDHRDLILALPGEISADLIAPAVPWFESLPARLQVELALIGEEALRTPELRDMVSGLAALVERYAAEARRLSLLPAPDCEISNQAAVAEEPAPYGEPPAPKT